MLAHCHLFEPSYHLFEHLHHLLINFEQHHHLLFWYAAFHLKNRALRHLFEQPVTYYCLFVCVSATFSLTRALCHLFELCITWNEQPHISLISLVLF